MARHSFPGALVFLWSPKPLPFTRFRSTICTTPERAPCLAIPTDWFDENLGQTRDWVVALLCFGIAPCSATTSRETAVQAHAFRISGRPHYRAGTCSAEIVCLLPANLRDLSAEDETGRQDGFCTCRR